MNPARPHWLERIPEVALGLTGDEGKACPVTFAIGAGGSLSSGGPRTEMIVERCLEKKPNVFTSEFAVYEKFSEAPLRERNEIIRPLFEKIEPYIGYRCLAAMARSRPVFVVNLNWDDCVVKAADLVDVPVERFDLKDFERGRRAIDAIKERGSGIVCAHVHGYLGDPDAERKEAEKEKEQQAEGVPEKNHGIRFAHTDTNGFAAGELGILEELLAPPTVIVGTSFVGSPDTHEMLQALLPEKKGVDQEAKAKAEPLWVFERGEPAQAPGFASRPAVKLSNALLARNSYEYFVGSPDVDFDLLMTALRAHEVGLDWNRLSPSKTRLPKLEEIVPPDPERVRPLLDESRSLIISAPRVGSSTLAYLVAWWHCLIKDSPSSSPSQVKELQGLDQALEYLQGDNVGRDGVGAVVIDDIFDERDDLEGDSTTAQLRAAVTRLGEVRLLATASPEAATSATCHIGDDLFGLFPVTTVLARELWRSNDLRAWAKARGGDRSEVVCREIRMGLITNPAQASRTHGSHTRHEQDRDWQRRLQLHLDRVYKYDKPWALALALLRLQDFSVPRSAATLVEAAGKDTGRELLGDPWGICTSIEVDGERYLRLSGPDVIPVIDEWLTMGRDDLIEPLRTDRNSARWAFEALEHWDTFRAAGGQELPHDFDPKELELFGSEYVRRALQDRDPARAVAVLQRIWDAKPDQWTAKDVALDLVLNWDRLQACQAARSLRDKLLKADKALGAYALFEALLRVGRPAPLEVWGHTVARLLDLSHRTSKSRSARQQITLAFDAMLWREAPVSHEQERKLVNLLLAAGNKDDRVAAMMAAACAYHLDGADRLEKAGFELPRMSAEFKIRQTREMAWVIAWHFAHQCRCRALTSRRVFLSTIDHSLDTEAPRYLDRSLRKNELNSAHRAAVVGLVDSLLRHAETAGWALHLIMNIHTTTGTFKVRDDQISRLHELLNPDTPGRGVLSAALTYMPTTQVHNLLLSIIKSERGAHELQKGLREGVVIEGTPIAEPRFSLAKDPWEIRRRWDAMPHGLPFGVRGPQELIVGLENVVDQAVEGGVERAAAERAISILARGDTVSVEGWARRRGADEESYLVLLTFIIAYYSRPQDG